MPKNLRWKLILTVLVTALAIAAFVPPSKKIHLGLDLQGGIHLVLKVKTDDALRVETETTSEQFKEALKTANVPYSAARVVSLTSFAIDGVPAGSDQQFRTVADQQLSAAFDRQASAGSYTFTMRENIVVQRRAEAVTQAIQTIDRRVNELGVSEPIVQPYGSAGDQIIVELPGIADTARAKNIIGNAALLSLHMVEDGPASDQATLLSRYNGVKPADMDIVPGSASRDDPTSMLYLLRHVPVITGRDLRTARQEIDSFNLPAVGFTLNAQGVTLFSAATSANVGRQLAIVLDNRVVSAPRIEGAITQPQAQITGRFTSQEAQDLALVLRSGALPASLSYEDQREIGPSLGKDSVRAGLTASIISLALVTAFMLIYYRLSGINAFVSIALNLIILMGFMSYLGAVMTLPGIAGFILTIGMGVDSNVLIFERIREELATNKGARPAMAAGFNRVFITIVDTHISSLIAAAFLFQFGTGSIRGFATTLFFGLI